MGMPNEKRVVGLVAGFPIALAVALAAQPACAQDTDTSESEGGKLQEIIVTAQRRGENLQRVPIAVSTVTADMATAMGIKGTQDIPLAAPAVNIAQTSAGASITIRGVGGNGTAIDESATALYVDGVYQAATPSLVFQLNNIERIEVLKGPQGTLFGRNSTGGVIQIITRTPTDQLTADASVTYANYDTVEAQGYVSGGLTDTVSADLALYTQHQGNGWGKNVVTGDDAYKGRSFVGRSKFLWKPDSDTRVTLALSYVNSKPTTSQGGNILAGETTRGIGGVSGRGTAGFYNLVSDAPISKTFQQGAAGLTIEHDFDWARLVSISSYANNHLAFGQDGDIGPANVSALDIRTRIYTTTQELQLQSKPGSAVKWSLGAFYFHNSVGVLPLTISGLSQGSATAATRINARSLTDSYSVYGQTTVPVLENTNLTAGLRYTTDKLKLRSTITSAANVVTPINDNATDSKLTWRLSVDQQLGPQLLAYVSYNRGYKSGLFNIVAPTQPKVDPQVLDAYEIGFKSQLFDNTVRFNASAFYYDFEKIQVRAASPTGAAFLLNAASARIKGIDTDLTITPIARLTLQSSLSYLHGRYRTFGNAPFFTPLASGGLAQSFGDASGNTTVFSPKWVGSAGATYSFDTGIGTFALNGSLYYNNGYFLEPQNRVRQDDYTQLGAGISWSPNDLIEARLWGRNLTKRKILSWLSAGTAGDQYYPGEPRTYGVTLRVRLN